MRDKGFYSAQQGTQTQTAADTALARLNAAKARLQTAELKRSKANVLAPDDGIISARSATVGTLTQPGQELFRLIRGGRLEWRAEVTAAEISRLKPGQAATLDSPNGETLEGVVRAISPALIRKRAMHWYMSICRPQQSTRSAPACLRVANSVLAKAWLLPSRNLPWSCAKAFPMFSGLSKTK